MDSVLTYHHPTGPPIAPDVATIVDLIRSENTLTRLDLVRRTGMGRNAVSALLHEAVELGLVAMAGNAPSTGGRAAQTWRFAENAGSVLTVCVETTSYRVALTDLAGAIFRSSWREWAIKEGPDATLQAVSEDLKALITSATVPLWGIGVSLPGPIDQVTGRPVAPPIMPGWDGFDVRGYLQNGFRLPVLVDNDVNVMVLGHDEIGGDRDAIYVEVGIGIGAGLLSHGRLHRGARGAAGDIGHTRISGQDNVICRCGRGGCLEAVAGGWALERAALRLAADGLSPYLADVKNHNGVVHVEDIVAGVDAADTSCIELVATAGAQVGAVLAVLVSFFNPEQIILAGPIPEGCPLFRETVRRVIVERALTLATDKLSIELAQAAGEDGVRGCARMVVDQVLKASIASN